MTTSECPCGRPRAGCTDHDPSLQQPPVAADRTPVTFNLKNDTTGMANRLRVGDRVTIPGYGDAVVERIDTDGTVRAWLPGKIHSVRVQGSVRV